MNNKFFVILAGRANSIAGQKLYACVKQGDPHRNRHTCNPACTDLLINSDQKPKPRSVWPSSLSL